MASHREVSVKVNAFVDEGIADLVAALSAIDGLVTVESCQGDAGEQDAFVYFRMRDWRQSGEFLFERLLPALPPDLKASVSFRLQGYDTDNAMGMIALDPRAVADLARAVRALPTTVGRGSLVASNAHRYAVA